MKRHKNKKRKWKVLLFFQIFFLLLLLIGGYLLYLVDQIPRSSISSDLAQVASPGRFRNIAIFGLDGDGSGTGGDRSDSIMVMSINRRNGQVQLFSVLRDTVMQQRGGNYSKANAAFARGGAEDAIWMLNRNLDLDIESYLMVNYNSLAYMVDILGGIEVDLSLEEINEMNRHVFNTAEVMGAPDVPFLDPAHTGVQTINGIQAVTYSRIRKGVGDDFARAERQREVLSKIMRKSVTAGPIKWNQMVRQVAPTIQTNLSTLDMGLVGVSILRMNQGETLQYPIDVATGNVSGLRGSFVIPVNVANNVRQLHEFLFGTIDYQPSSTVQQISSDITSMTGR